MANTLRGNSGNESVWRGPLRRKPRAHSGAANRGSEPAVKNESYLPRLALGGWLEFSNIFVPDNKGTFVHLAQAVQEYGNIDFPIFTLVFKWLEPAVEKGVFYAVD
jgi:hypothetical protein